MIAVPQQNAVELSLVSGEVCLQQTSQYGDTAYIHVAVSNVPALIAALQDAIKE